MINWVHNCISELSLSPTVIDMLCAVVHTYSKCSQQYDSRALAITISYMDWLAKEVTEKCCQPNCFNKVTYNSNEVSAACSDTTTRPV